MEGMDHRRLFTFFQGLWTFMREVRSLDAPFQLLTSVTEGKASFQKWETPDILSQSQDDVTRRQAESHQTPSQWLLYREHGSLKNHQVGPNTPPGVVTRQYLYDFTNHAKLHVYHCAPKQRTPNLLDPWSEVGNDVVCNFERGKPFHDIEFPPIDSGLQDIKSITEMEATSEHVCVPDLYKGHFILIDWNTVSVKWTVTGPRKSFLIQTMYHRR